MRLNFIFGLALGLIGLAGTVSAQGVANNTTFGDWVVRCEAVSSTQTTCRLVQVLTRNEDQSLVARFIGIPRQDGNVVLLAQVPMGVFLPGGAVFRAEGAPEGVEQKRMVWQRCQGKVCEAAISLTPEDLKTFTKSGAILFGYRMQPKVDPVVVRIDVSQFEEAIGLIGKAP